MISKLIILSLILIGGSIGYNFLPDLFEHLFPNVLMLHSQITGLIIGGVIGLLLSTFLIGPIKHQASRIKDAIKEVNASYLLFGGIGALLGLLIAWLINLPLAALSIPVVSDVLPVILTIILAYIGFELLATRREEIRRFMMERPDKPIEDEAGALYINQGVNFKQYKILDTSVIIDGRILDIVRTGFLEGILVVSVYVLQELQHIADSSDSLIRVRGRRGLDILNALQKEENITVQMDESEIEESDEVDTKLVILARKLDGVVMTNDFNLNKVAEIRNVPVLNINELANSVKPVVLPGEEMTVKIVKKGTERNQGVAYLDDGTMVVVEEGKFYIDETMRVMVTSALQTNAGRMIFAKIVDGQHQIANSNQ